MGAAVTTMTDAQRWERSARFWLRAYPRRWRVVRTNEVLAVLMDLAAPGARRVGVRTALDLLRGGWATRWRGHPPLWTWITYRFEKKIPRRYRGWAGDDIEGFLFPARRMGFATWFYPILAFQNRGTSAPLWPWWGWLVAMVVLPMLGLVLGPERYREQARQRHLAAEAGEPLTAGLYVGQPARRPRISAGAAAPRLVGGVGLAAVLSAGAALRGKLAVDASSAEALRDSAGALAFLTTSPGLTVAVVVVLAVALGVGLLRARRATHRLARALPSRPPQPHRTMTTSHRTADAWSILGLMAAAADAWLEGTGRWPLLFSPIIAIGTWVVLPWAVALVRYRDPEPGRPPLAWSDLRWAAGWGTLPTVDQPLAVVRPYEGPEGDGAVVAVWPWRVGSTEASWPPTPA